MTTPQEMVRLITEQLSKNVGVASISVDGQTMVFTSREKMIAELLVWERRATAATAVVEGKPVRRMFKSVDISRAFDGDKWR